MSKKSMFLFYVPANSITKQNLFGQSWHARIVHKSTLLYVLQIAFPSPLFEPHHSIIRLFFEKSTKDNV